MWFYALHILIARDKFYQQILLSAVFFYQFELTQKLSRELLCLVLWGFRPGLTQTGLYNQRWLDASNFGLRKYRDCTIRVVKTKMLISFAVTVKLICVFVFAYSKSRVSHNQALSYPLPKTFIHKASLQHFYHLGKTNFFDKIGKTIHEINCSSKEYLRNVNGTYKMTIIALKYKDLKL